LFCNELQTKSITSDCKQFHRFLSTILLGIESLIFISYLQVWTSGRNHHHALGVIPPPLNSLQPVHVSLLQDHHIVGCAAGLYHTVVWSRNSLFTFGTNAGQLGAILLVSLSALFLIFRFRLLICNISIMIFAFTP